LYESATGQPALAVGSPLPALFVLDVDDSSSRYGGGSGEAKVTDFEQHSHVAIHNDAIGVGKRQDFVVVHHRVHGLDPVSVEVTVENNPLGIGIFFFAEFLELLGKDALLPRTGRVVVTLEFRGINRLGVDVSDLCRLAFDALCFGAGLPAGTFERTRITHHEHTMSDHQHI